MNSEIRTKQNHCDEYSDWLYQVDNVNDIEASKVNGGISSPGDDLEARANELYGHIIELQMNFQETTAGSKVAKDQSGKVSA